MNRDTEQPERSTNPMFGDLWQVPMFLLGVLALALVAATAPLRQDPILVQFQAEIKTLRQGLADPSEKIQPLLASAENLLVKIDRFPNREGEVHFLIGSTYWRLAEEGSLEQVTPTREKAIEHLEKALTQGISEEDMPCLQFRLGMLLYRQGHDLGRATELIAQGIPRGTNNPAQGFELLAEAYMRQNPANVEAALLANQKYLEQAGDNEEALAQGRLLRGDLLFRSNRKTEALRVLSRIGAGAPKNLRLQARILQIRCCEAEGLWRQAIPFWKELLEDPAIVPGGKARIYYGLGLCFSHNEPPETEAALANWDQARQLGGEEAQAAALRFGEIRLNDDPAATLKAWSEALAQVQTVKDYSNQYIDINQLREIFEAACRQLLEAQNYVDTEQLAELFRKVALPGQAELQIAQAAEARARQLLDKGTSGNQTGPLFLKAAQAYEKVAQVQTDKDQANFLWRSAACYLPARGFAQAARVLEQFVKLEKTEARLAEGWLALAEAELALGQKDKARQAYYKCIEYPDTPFVYRARNQLAVQEQERKNLDQVISILKQNLNSSSAAIDREAHEKSLYMLGAILFQEQKFDQAHVYLKEATRQYPRNPQILTAQDQLSDCFRKLADQAGKKIQEIQTPEVREHYQRTRYQWLEQAAVAYQIIADNLEKLANKTPLSADDLRLMRKAFFAAADMYLEMNDVPEALRRFQLLQDRYRKQVEGLIACQRIWLCRSRVQDPPDRVRQIQQAAQAALQMAQADLQAMDENSPAFRGGPGVWRKQDWESWLSWMQNQLTQPNGPTNTAVPASRTKKED